MLGITIELEVGIFQDCDHDLILSFLVVLLWMSMNPFPGPNPQLWMAVAVGCSSQLHVSIALV